MKIERVPRISIAPEAYARMFAYAREAEGEIMGFGTVEELAGDFHISEVYIMPQVAGGAHVNVDGNTLLDLQKWFRDQGQPERVEKARFWWHSHVNFSVFRSGTDRGTTDLLSRMMPYLICTVVNKAGEHETTFIQNNPAISLTNLKLHREHFNKDTMDSEVSFEVKSLVKQASYRYQPTHKHEVAREVVKPVEAKVETPIKDEWDRYEKDQPSEQKSFLEMTYEEWQAWQNKHFATGIEEPGVEEQEK